MKAKFFKIIDNSSFIFTLENWSMYHREYPNNSIRVKYILCSIVAGYSYVHYCNENGELCSPILGMCKSGKIREAAAKASIKIRIPKAFKVLYGNK